MEDETKKLNDQMELRVRDRKRDDAQKVSNNIGFLLIAKLLILLSRTNTKEILSRRDAR